MGRRCDGETRGRTFPSSGVGRLQRASKGAHVLLAGIVVGRRTLSTVLLAGFYDLPLPFPNIHAPLKLLSHRRVVGVEAGRQAGQTDVVQVLPGGQARGPCCEGARGVDDVRVGKVEAAGAVARVGHVGRRGLLLHDDLGSLRA